MNKASVRKEISSLIDSIKQHSDDIGTKQHIPQLELELILHKIKKLYEKSIVFNYLNSLPEEEPVIIDPKQIELFNVSDTDKKESKEINEPPTSVKTLFAEEILEDKASKKVPEKEKKKESSDKSVADKLQKKPIIDIKTAIGINEKFQFINELFESNAQEYNIAINQLNICNSFSEAEAYIKSLKEIYKWKDDSPVALSFTDLVERRFLST